LASPASALVAWLVLLAQSIPSRRSSVCRALAESEASYAYRQIPSAGRAGLSHRSQLVVMPVLRYPHANHAFLTNNQEVALRAILCAQ
jgi:hypothetical protein